jgi:hypothetical protein
MTRTELEDELAYLFEDAIADSWDMDWEFIDGARSCAKALMAEPELVTYLIISMFGAPTDNTIN